MDDQQKSRMVLILVAGVLLLGGGGWWVMSQNNNAEKAENQANADIPKQPANPGATATSTGAAPATNPGAAPAANPGAAPATADASKGGDSAPKGKLLGLSGMAPDEDTVAAGAKIASAAVPGGAPPLPPVAAPPAPKNDATLMDGPPKTKYVATKRDDATATAKTVAGREDPMMGTFDKTPYPGPWTKAGSGPGAHTTVDDEKKDKPQAFGGTVPPPPPRLKEPPAPPSAPSMSAEAAPQLPIDNLPQPPDKPMVTPKLKLSAIIGNKAVLSVPIELRTANKWPAVICLGPGERFDDPTNGSFSVVSVDPDSVTIEEEQERSVKSLPQIK